MGFGKIKKEVEASGLDPQVAHADLTVDGRLVSGVVNVPDSVSVEQIEVDGFAPNTETSSIMEKALEEFRAETAVDEEQVKSNQEDDAETKENEEDIAYVQKLLFDNLKQVEETEEVQESPKTDSKVKEKKAPTKKKPTKK